MSETQETPNEQEQSYEDFIPDFSFVPGRHSYRQQGFYLVCNSCVLQHAVFVGPELLMVGEDTDGQPILQKRESLNTV